MMRVGASKGDLSASRDATIRETVPSRIMNSRIDIPPGDLTGEAARTARLCKPEDLVRLMRAGDIEALDRITRCFGSTLLAAGRRHCRDEDRARDAVQDALVAAGEHLQDFRGEGTPQGWLVRMVANACARMRRGRKNSAAWNAELDPEVVLGDHESPEIAAARAQLAARLGDALIELSPADRAIVLLSEAEDWTGPEIAEALGMTPGAVRVRLTRLRAKLRGALADAHPDAVAPPSANEPAVRESP